MTTETADASRRTPPLGAILLAAVFFASGPALGAQSPSAVRVGSDNDAFAFWIPPWDRSDREYTSGVIGSLDYRGRSAWLGFLGLKPRPAYNGASHTFSIGQEIYTGQRPGPWDVGTDTPRPNAGWLYVSLAERDSTARVQVSRSVAIGVVGPPALAEPMQRFFHNLGPEYQRVQDWSHQLPFEPGLQLRYDIAARLLHGGEDAGWNSSVTWNSGLALGTIKVGGMTGGELRLATPAPTHEFVPRLVVSADAALHNVIRDEFLDGTFFRSSDHVKKNAFYDERGVTLALYWRQVSVRYRGAYTSNQYPTQPGGLKWGSLSTEWRP